MVDYTDVINQIKSVLINIMSLGWLKSLFSLIALAFAWIFDDSRGTLPALTVALLICLDSLSGMVAAVKSGEGLSSRKAKRILWKFIIYSIGIITGRLVDKMIPTPAFAVIIEVFLAMTEAQSIIENLGRAGMPIPRKIELLFSILKDKAKNKD